MTKRALTTNISERTSTGVSNGWLALIFFILIEALLFLFLIGSIGYLRARGAPWPPPGVAQLDRLFPAINLAVLLISGALAYLAERIIRRGNLTLAEKFLLAASGLGILFLLGQIREYAVLFFNGITLSSNLYGSLFYLAIGFHGAHVLSGIVWLVAASRSTRAGKQMPAHHFGVQAAALYWEFVSVVWVALFVLLYLV